MTQLPDPPVPADADLRSFPYMPLDVQRLRDSDLAGVSDAELFRLAVLSWCAAWHQQPAGSLPDDDGALSRLLGFGRDGLKAWKKCRANGALRGWEKHSDGRLYHPVVVEKVLAAVAKRTAAKQKGKAGAAKRWGDGSSHATAIAQASPSHSSGNGSAMQLPLPENGKGREGNRREEKGEREARAPASAETPSPNGLNEKAWTDWRTWRAGSDHGPIEPAQVEAAQRLMLAFGTEQQAVVDQAIAGGWKNLLPIKRVNGEGSPDAVAAWDRMRQQQGAGTDPKIRKALDAIGGYQRVSMMKTTEVSIVRRQFLKAYGEAA